MPMPPLMNPFGISIRTQFNFDRGIEKRLDFHRRGVSKPKDLPNYFYFIVEMCQHEFTLCPSREIGLQANSQRSICHSPIYYRSFSTSCLNPVGFHETFLLQIGSNDKWFFSDSIKHKNTQVAYCCIDQTPDASKHDG